MKNPLITLRKRREEKRNAYWASIRRAERAHWDLVLRRDSKKEP